MNIAHDSVWIILRFGWNEEINKKKHKKGMFDVRWGIFEKTYDFRLGVDLSYPSDFILYFLKMEPEGSG